MVAVRHDHLAIVQRVTVPTERGVNRARMNIAELSLHHVGSARVTAWSPDRIG